jgi:hypothetical protein
VALLPIAYTDIGTPYRLNNDGNFDYQDAGDNRPSAVDQGGDRFHLQLSLVPMNERLRALDVDDIDTFLESEMVFDVPVINRRATAMTGSWAVSGPHSVGDTVINVSPGAGAPHVGQVIRFGTNMKINRVKSYAAGAITLTRPLRQALIDTEQVVYSEVDAKGNTFNGVLGRFLNTDFKDTSPVVQRSIWAQFGPYRLVEWLS